MISISTSEVRAEKRDLDLPLKIFFQCAAISHFVRGFRLYASIACGLVPC